MSQVTEVSGNVIELRDGGSAHPPAVVASGAALILDGQSMSSMMELAKIMASGRSTIPKHLQGNTGDCMAVIMQAMSWRMNPFSVAQKTHLVNGALGFEAQLINAAIFSSGLLKGRPEYEWYGDWSRVIGNYKEVESKKNPGETYRRLASTAADEKGCGVKVSITLKGEDKPRVLDLLLTQAGVRNSPLWADDPRQQLAYLAIKRWARLYTPDVILGVYSPDEIEDVRPPQQERDMGAADVVEKSRADTVRDKLDGKPNAKAPTLDQVLASIKAASTTDDMEVAAAAAAKIIDTKDKEIARKAWGDRLKELKAATAAAAAPEPANAGPAKTFAEVAEAINKAASMDELNLAMDLIRAVVDQEQQNELRDAAIQRKDQLSPI